jgi:sugar (pentulose or hexulose) kinase
LDGVAAAAIELAAAVTDATGSPDEVRLTGGFLGNNAWAQLMTDALGLPTSIPQPEAATSTGAAMIGWLASDPARGITPPGAADQRRPRPVAHQLLAAKSLRARRFREWQMTDHDE